MNKEWNNFCIQFSNLFTQAGKVIKEFFDDRRSLVNENPFLVKGYKISIIGTMERLEINGSRRYAHCDVNGKIELVKITGSVESLEINGYKIKVPEEVMSNVQRNSSSK